jgi:hypothetical protein
MRKRCLYSRSLISFPVVWEPAQRNHHELSGKLRTTSCRWPGIASPANQISDDTPSFLASWQRQGNLNSHGSAISMLGRGNIVALPQTVSSSSGDRRQLSLVFCDLSPLSNRYFVTPDEKT